MSSSGLISGIGIAIILYVFVTFFMFNIFMLISPMFGCRPIGNGNSIFSTDFSSSQSLLSTCPAGSQVYEGLLFFVGVIILVLLIFLGRLNIGYSIITAGIFFPSIIYIIGQAGYANIFNSIITEIIMTIAVVSGVIISWMD